MEKQLETIFSVNLPYQETLNIRRSVYQGSANPRVAVVAGIDGDELEGLYICHCLAARLEALNQTHPHALRGRVELYPALNPLGLDTLQRRMSGYASDLTLSFPGYAEGSLPQRIAAAMLAYLQDAALVIVIRAGHLYQRELPQIRIDRRFADALFPLAQRLRPAVICLQAASKNVETTLDYNLNTRGARCLLVKMGTGMGLTPHFCAPLLTGILTVWQDLSVLAFDVELPTRRYHPLVTDDDHIHNIRAAISGLFIATSEEYRVNVTSGEQIGRIVSPFEGQVLAEIHAPVTGALLTQRRYSLVYEGSLLARVAEKCT